MDIFIYLVLEILHVVDNPVLVHYHFQKSIMLNIATFSLQVQRLSKDGLLPKFLSTKYSKTETPFFGCAFMGAITAVMATLGDLTSLLLLSGMIYE